MSPRPRLLDLFCGAGGAAMGYHMAGFDVVGVDLRPQPHYPFEFHQGDALAFALDGFDAIHASPPCQAYSALRSSNPGREYPDLVAPTRERLEASGLPWVIENVPGAPLRHQVVLCGSMFGLGAHDAQGRWRQLRRHRLFESNVPMMAPTCQHSGLTVGVYGHGRWDNSTSKHRGGYQGNAEECRTAMGIDWCARDGVAQAIPPAYAEFIGGWLLRAAAARRS